MARGQDSSQSLARATGKHDDATARSPIAEHLAERFLLVVADHSRRLNLNLQIGRCPVPFEIVLLNQRQIVILAQFFYLFNPFAMDLNLLLLGLVLELGHIEAIIEQLERCVVLFVIAHIDVPKNLKFSLEVLKLLDLLALVFLDDARHTVSLFSPDTLLVVVHGVQSRLHAIGGGLGRRSVSVDLLLPSHGLLNNRETLKSCHDERVARLNKELIAPEDQLGLAVAGTVLLDELLDECGNLLVFGEPV